MHSQVFVIIANGHVLSLLQFPLMLLNESIVDLDLGCLCELPNELEIRLVGQATCEPQEWLLEVVIASCTEVIVLQIAFSVELDVFCFDLAILHVNLVTNQNDG